MNEFLYSNNQGQLSETFQNYCINALKEAKSNFIDVRNELLKINENLDYILREIENSINKLEQKSSNITGNNLGKKELFSKLKDYMNSYSNTFDDIVNINNNIKTQLDNLTDFEFNPPANINSFYDPMNDFSNSNEPSHINALQYSDYFKDFNEFNDNDKIENSQKKEILIKCSVCNSEESSYLCKHCNIFLCIKCRNKFTNNEVHNFLNLDDIKSQNEKNKINFFNSLEILIKVLFQKCNYLLKNEKIPLENIESTKNSEKKVILKIMDYPSITNANDIKEHICFLQGINSLLPENYENDFYKNSFQISKLNLKLIQVIKNIFYDKDINLIKDIIDQIDNNFFTEEDEGNKTYLLTEYDKTKENFYYTLNLVPKNDFGFDEEKIRDFLINKFETILSINKKDVFISFNNGNDFIDNFIRTKNFTELSCKEIIKQYPKFEKIYEIKLLIDNLLVDECKIKNNLLDYKGNSIDPNKELYLFKDSEYYYLPYGWIGIGLKKKKWDIKPNNCEIAYYCINNTLSSDEIKKRINKLITFSEPFLVQNNEDKNEDYLYPEINVAENLTGMIDFNKKKYKILLMVMALIDKKMKTEKYESWISRKIIAFKILFKEII